MRRIRVFPLWRIAAVSGCAAVLLGLAWTASFASAPNAGVVHGVNIVDDAYQPATTNAHVGDTIGAPLVGAPNGEVSRRSLPLLM